jgi:hypothetical protein
MEPDGKGLRDAFLKIYDAKHPTLKINHNYDLVNAAHVFNSHSNQRLLRRVHSRPSGLQSHSVTTAGHA